MKKVIFLLLLVPLVSFGQSQMLNGIEINAPLGFKKTGNLEWEKDDDIIVVGSVKQIWSDSDIKKGISQETRGSSFIKFFELEINGINHFISLNKGKNGYSILMTGVRKNEHTYFVTVGVNPENYLSQKKAFDEGFQHLSYMIVRLLNY